MQLLTRFGVNWLVLFLALLPFAMVFARASAQENPARNEIPPWQRVLKGEDAKRVEELEKKIQELRQAGKYTEAQAAARTVLEIRRRVQGEEHWETIDALRGLQTLEQIAALPAEGQTELADVARIRGQREFPAETHAVPLSGSAETADPVYPYMASG